MINYLFILLTCAGVIMVILGIQWMVDFLYSEELIVFPISDKTAEFEVKNQGFYSITIIGGYVRNTGNFEAKLVDKASGSVLSISYNRPRPSFFNDGVPRVDYMNFHAVKGVYQLSLRNTEQLILKKSISPLNALFQRKVPLEKIFILVKGTIPVSKFFLSIIFLPLGMNMLVWGIILLSGIFNYS